MPSLHQTAAYAGESNGMYEVLLYVNRVESGQIERELRPDQPAPILLDGLGFFNQFRDAREQVT